MAYCTTSDVQTMLDPVVFKIGQTDADGSVDEPNNTTIGTILIPAADQIIDGQLRDLYAVPITNATDLQLVRFISMRFAAAMCGDYLFGGRADPDVNTVLLSRQETAQRHLDMIRNGTVKLLTTRSSFVDTGIHASFTEAAGEHSAKVTMGDEF